jgi:hypothetical protein
MGWQPTPWSKRIFEMLADGPQERETLIQATMGLVPPGRAYRRAEKNRANIAKFQGREVTPRPVDETLIFSGARHIIAMSLAQFVRSGRLIKEGTTYRIGRDAEYNIEKVQRWWKSAPPEERERAIRLRTEGKRRARLAAKGITNDQA